MADDLMTPEEMEQIRQEVNATFATTGPALFQQNALADIRHVIGVVSGKGGVGKSLVSGLLAIELARRGAKVAILDADITGPSIPHMLGLSDVRLTGDPDSNLIIPAQTKGGIKVVSTNLVLEHETDPVLWRGPILMGVLKQFWEEVMWGPIDYMIVDMPPGTGDVALTVFQQFPLWGIIVVTSPQDLVRIVVSKAVNMAQQMDVPILGIIENMAWITCPHCGKRIEVFGPDKIAKTAAACDIDVLARLPFDPALAAACDAGQLEKDAPEGLLSAAASRVIELCAIVDASQSQAHQKAGS